MWAVLYGYVMGLPAADDVQHLFFFLRHIKLDARNIRHER